MYILFQTKITTCAQSTYTKHFIYTYKCNIIEALMLHSHNSNKYKIEGNMHLCIPPPLYILEPYTPQWIVICMYLNGTFF